MRSKALILIEFQDEWLSPEGKLRNLMRDKDQFEHSIKKAKKALNEARNRGMHIIHVTMTLDSQYQLLGQGKYGLRKIIPEARTWLTPHSKITKDFEPIKGEYIIKERSGASAFSGTSLDSYLRNNKVFDIYLMGYALHVCVESTLRHGHDLGYNVTVIEDASSAFTDTQKLYFTKEICHHFGRCSSLNDFFSEKHEMKNKLGAIS